MAVLVHGVFEHSGRYEHVGRYLADRGIGVVGFDQRGFGQSGGRRGWIAHFDDFLDDVEDHLLQVRGVGVPVVLLGHSMGGLLVADYAVSDRPQPDAYVVSGAPLSSLAPDPVLDRLARLAAPLLGSLRTSSRLPSSVLSRDQAVGEAYDADPLVDPLATIDLWAAMLDAIDHTRADLDRIRRPMLAMAGEADELVPPASTRLLQGRQGVDTVFYPGHRHEIFNELDWEDVLADVVEWLGKRLG